MITLDRIQDAGNFVELLRQLINGKTLPLNNRSRAASSCFAITQEHHHAIVLLIQHQLYASSFSLLRIAFEAYIRGLWLLLCASEKQIKNFIQGKEPPKIGDLIFSIEKTPTFSKKILSQLKANNWDAMCAYTHTGGLHIQRWNTTEAIEPNYSPEEIAEVLSLTEIIGVMSIVSFAELTKNEQLALIVLEKFNEYKAK